jgi:hypothetical protein
VALQLISSETEEMMTPINICVTGAAGQIAYSLLPYLCNGSIFDDQPIHLNLLDIPATLEVLKGASLY